MTPLRGVPFRVVVLVGVDQPAFSVGAPDGDDLAAATPLLGDRDRRGESRQALLESVLAARDLLVLIREGHDVRTNQVTPRAVPVAELVDAVLAMVPDGHRAALADRLEVAHPRQPFDERVFVPGALVGEGPWGFDEGALQGALARRLRGHTAREFLPAPLDPWEQPVIELAELQAFCKEPIAHFVQRRLGVRLPRRDEAPPPLVPLDLDALERWQVGDRLFTWLLDGGTAPDWEVVERRLGTLGPGSFGRATITDVRSIAEALVDAAERVGVRRGPARQVPVEVVLGDGTRVVGSVDDRLDGRPGPARLTYSAVRPAYRLAAWLDLLALVGTDPGVPWRSVGVHKGEAKEPVAVVQLDVAAPVGDPADRRRIAVAALEVVVDCYRRGSVEPLPLFPRVSHDLWSGQSGASNWRRYPAGGDGESAFNRLVHGDRELRDLLRVPRRHDDPLTRSGERASRPQCFAEYLWDAYAASVVDLAESPEPA